MLVWFVRHCPMRIFRWDEFFCPTKESVFAPVWIRIEGLPLYLFDAPSLWSIANAIGKPLRINPSNLSRSNLKSAQICVELNVAAPLIDSIWISFEDDVSKSKLEGFWVYCTACYHIGHDVVVCKRLKDGAVTEQNSQHRDASQTAARVFHILPQPARSVKIGVQTAMENHNRLGIQETASKVWIVKRQELSSGPCPQESPAGDHCGAAIGKSDKATTVTAPVVQHTKIIFNKKVNVPTNNIAPGAMPVQSGVVVPAVASPIGAFTKATDPTATGAVSAEAAGLVTASKNGNSNTLITTDFTRSVPFGAKEAANVFSASVADVKNISAPDAAVLKKNNTELFEQATAEKEKHDLKTAFCVELQNTAAPSQISGTIQSITAEDTNITVTENSDRATVAVLSSVANVVALSDKQIVEGAGRKVFASADYKADSKEVHMEERQHRKQPRQMSTKTCVLQAFKTTEPDPLLDMLKGTKQAEKTVKNINKGKSHAGELDLQQGSGVSATSKAETDASSLPATQTAYLQQNGRRNLEEFDKVAHGSNMQRGTDNLVATTVDCKWVKTEPARDKQQQSIYRDVTEKPTGQNCVAAIKNHVAAAKNKFVTTRATAKKLPPALKQTTISEISANPEQTTDTSVSTGSALSEVSAVTKQITLKPTRTKDGYPAVFFK